MVKYLSLFFVTILISCAIKTRMLDDQITAVPIDNKVFKNKLFFEKSLLNKIDTTAIYISEYSYQSNKENFKKRDNKIYKSRDYHNACYKFYGNGCLSYFSAYDVDFYDSVKVNDLNTSINGQRGVYYIKDNQIQMDLFTIVGYNFKREYGINTSVIEIRGDTLLRKSKFDLETVNVCVKKKLPKEFLIYKPDW